MIGSMVIWSTSQNYSTGMVVANWAILSSFVDNFKLETQQIGVRLSCFAHVTALTSKVGYNGSSVMALIIVPTSSSLLRDDATSRARFALRRRNKRVEEKLIISAGLWKKSMTGSWNVPMRFSVATQTSTRRVEPRKVTTTPAHQHLQKLIIPYGAKLRRKEALKNGPQLHYSRVRQELERRKNKPEIMWRQELPAISTK
jgi:hypothetical protein